MKTEATMTRATGQPNGESLPWTPILLYHRIVPEIQGHDEYNLCVTKAAFEAQMSFLKEHGYQPVSVEDLARGGPSDGLHPKRVAITFDDGYLDTFQYALPVLKKFQFTATVFAVSSCVGHSNVWDDGRVEAVPLMGLEELRELSRQGLFIGSHSVTHRCLRDLGTADAWEEIHASKSALEDALQVGIRSFAYPYGCCSPVLEGLVEKAGYVAACGIERPHHRPFQLSRIDATTCFGAGLLWRWKVSGLYFGLRKSRLVRMLRASPSSAANGTVGVDSGPHHAR